MNQIWNLTIDDYLNIVDLAKAEGLKPGDSMESVLLQYVKEKGIKSIGATELNKTEFINEQLSHGKNVLSIEAKGGKEKYKYYKKDSE